MLFAEINQTFYQSRIGNVTGLGLDVKISLPTAFRLLCANFAVKFRRKALLANSKATIKFHYSTKM